MGRLIEGKSGTDPETGLSKIQQLRPHHRSMARMMVCGKRPGELCDIFGLSAAQISVITATPLFQAELSRLESLADYESVDMGVELKLRQGMALEAIDRALVQPDPQKAATVGFEILDRTGFPKGVPVQKHLHAHLHQEIRAMSEEELLTEVMSSISSEEESL
jgi:hypothetical protein